MEITLNQPVKEWYRNSTLNDLSYWGIDYPPLTAYKSYFHGIFLKFLDPVSVSLFTSRGYESYIGKLLMRWNVLMYDLMIFFPAVLCFAKVYSREKSVKTKSNMVRHTAMILSNTCLILIDHVHFRLGLTTAAVAAILSDRDLVGSLLFSLALNHKQVLSRLAPFEIGLYEDYVANFWCTTSVVVKWKKLFTTVTETSYSCLNYICMFTINDHTITYQTKFYAWTTQQISLIISVLIPRVHEKSIMLPPLPASFLALEEPFIFRRSLYYALLSIFPLLSRDKLALPYAALYCLFILFYDTPGARKDPKEKDSFSPNLKSLVFPFSLALHIIYLTITPPQRYPFLFEAMIVLNFFLKAHNFSGQQNFLRCIQKKKIIEILSLFSVTI